MAVGVESFDLRFEVGFEIIGRGPQLESLGAPSARSIAATITEPGEGCRAAEPF